MAKAYSADMRQRVIDRVEIGASRREAAEHYEVSVPPNRVAGARRRWRSTRTFCWRLIELESDLTFNEVVYAMRKLEIPGSRTAVWRFFQRHKITFKKKPVRSGAAARGRSRYQP
jgi:transposase